MPCTCPIQTLAVEAVNNTAMPVRYAKATMKGRHHRLMKNAGPSSDVLPAWRRGVSFGRQRSPDDPEARAGDSVSESSRALLPTTGDQNFQQMSPTYTCQWPQVDTPGQRSRHHADQPKETGREQDIRFDITASFLQIASEMFICNQLGHRTLRNRRVVASVKRISHYNGLARQKHKRSRILSFFISILFIGQILNHDGKMYQWIKG